MERHVKYLVADLEPVNLRCYPKCDIEDIPAGAGEWALEHRHNAVGK